MGRAFQQRLPARARDAVAPERDVGEGGRVQQGGQRREGRERDVEQRGRLGLPSCAAQRLRLQRGRQRRGGILVSQRGGEAPRVALDEQQREIVGRHGGGGASAGTGTRR